MGIAGTGAERGWLLSVITYYEVESNFLIQNTTLFHIKIVIRFETKKQKTYG